MCGIHNVLKRGIFLETGGFPSQTSTAVWMVIYCLKGSNFLMGKLLFYSFTALILNPVLTGHKTSQESVGRKRISSIPPVHDSLKSFLCFWLLCFRSLFTTHIKQIQQALQISPAFPFCNSCSCIDKQTYLQGCGTKDKTICCCDCKDCFQHSGSSDAGNFDLHFNN